MSIVVMREREDSGVEVETQLTVRLRRRKKEDGGMEGVEEEEEEEDEEEEVPEYKGAGGQEGGEGQAVRRRGAMPTFCTRLGLKLYTE